MCDKKRSLDDQVAALRAAFGDALPERLRELDGVWSHLRGGQWDAERYRAAMRLAHNLAGAGATFGYPAISDASRFIENALQQALDARQPLSGHLRQAVDTRLGGMAAAPAAAPAGEPAHVPPPPGPGQNAGPHPLLIYLVEDDAALAANFQAQLEHFGYEVVTLNEPGALAGAAARRAPAAVVMDIVFDGDDLAGTHSVSALRERGFDAPVVFLSARDDFQARLAAVRAGGNAYLAKPVDAPRLVDQLDALTGTGVSEPYRVLVVDDDVALTEHYSAVLKAAGMRVEVVNDPLQVSRCLAEFRPELIQVDMYMPGCSGPELASVVRQQEAYLDIPIVFLSSEQDVDRQLAAMSLGGDDFLTKPIPDGHLVAAVATRVERYRALRALVARDGLTGALNHSRIKRRLESELSRAGRHGHDLCYVMLDLDRFKSVNDRFGHATGDRVLKSIARLLHQRLRRSDVVGRYGGEEFAVIMPETDIDSAAQVMQALRRDFSSIEHQSREGAFSVTFSCGIAAYPEHTDAAGLSEAADAALYAAKEAGRNRVACYAGGALRLAGPAG